MGGTPGEVWINGSMNAVVAAHELGHNFGLYHSHALECGSVAMGGSCSTIDYGDVLDVMGSGSPAFNAVQKDLLGWLDYGVSPPTDVVASGSTQLMGSSPGRTKALRCRRARRLVTWSPSADRFDSYLASTELMRGVLSLF